MGLRPSSYKASPRLETKKGEPTMSEVKTFIKNHKKEIVLVASGIIIFNVGFRYGYKSAIKAIDRFVIDCAKSIQVTQF